MWSGWKFRDETVSNEAKVKGVTGSGQLGGVTKVMSGGKGVRVLREHAFDAGVIENEAGVDGRQ